MDPDKNTSAPQSFDEASEQRFREEAKRFNLVYTCDDCMHFNHTDERCMELYPTEVLRTPDHPVRLAEKDWIFCKCFEFG
jgi:hypothetical protein